MALHYLSMNLAPRIIASSFQEALRLARWPCPSWTLTLRSAPPTRRRPLRPLVGGDGRNCRRSRALGLTAHFPPIEKRCASRDGGLWGRFRLISWGS